MTRQTGMMIGAGSILLYTLLGGMWSVAVTDFVQMIIIVIGMIYIAFVVGSHAGGADVVLAKASAEGKFQFLPAMNPKDLLAFIAASITLMMKFMYSLIAMLNMRRTPRARITFRSRANASSASFTCGAAMPIASR